ncbi:MAG: flagellar hook-associated protein FlgL [Myxococcota bacterium]
MSRVTESMIYGSMRGQIERSQNRLLDANDVASTGRRANRPSDDPVAVDREMLFRSYQNRLESMDRVSNRVRDDLSVTESALNDSQNILTRTRKIAINAGNGALNERDRGSLAAEVGEMREALLSLANSEVAGRYVFGGNATGGPPFQDDGTFVGDGAAREVEVLDGRTVRANIPGSEVFAGGAPVDVFQLLEDLETDLLNNDSAGATSRLDDIASALQQVEDGRTQIGVAVNSLDNSDDLRAEIDERLNEAILESVGEDQAASYVDLVEAQTAMQNALQQAARILSGFQQSPLF